MKVNVIVNFKLSTSFQIWQFDCTLDEAVSRTSIDYFTLVILYYSTSSSQPSVISPVSCKVSTTLLAAFALFIGGHRKLQVLNFTPSVQPFLTVKTWVKTPFQLQGKLISHFEDLTYNPIDEFLLIQLWNRLWHQLIFQTIDVLAYHQ